MVFMADHLAALNDTADTEAETEFVTDLRTENTFPGVRSIISVPSAEPHSYTVRLEDERFLTTIIYSSFSELNGEK